MSILKRYTKSVDGTIPVQALLYDDEELLASQDGVGIYDGTQKAPHHQAGTVHTTTHRLFYIDNSHSRSRSFWLDLSHVTRTEYYAGLLRSSSKITLHLNPLAQRSEQGPSAPTGTNVELAGLESWECAVCSYRNPPGLSPAASRVCALCGVPRSSVPASSVPTPSVNRTGKPFAGYQQLSAHHLSSSLPSSSANLHSLVSTNPALHEPEGAEIACSACTFLNHPSLRECEICGTTLPRGRNSAKSAPASRPGSDDEEDDDGSEGDDQGPRIMKLSFRKGGDKPFYAVLRRSLLSKGWEGQRSQDTIAQQSGAVATAGRSGINGILQNVETTASSTQTKMEDALQDLEALMVKAREMVRIAEELNERLTSASSAHTSSNIDGTALGAAAASDAVEPEEATFIRSSLAQLGLQMSNAPVTLDMIRDERRWTEELAKELAGVLQGTGGKTDSATALMARRGIVGLDEVWGGWNRARGVALIPPATFLLVLPHLPGHTSPPIHTRTFASGLSVLHTPQYSKAAFAARLVGLIKLSGPKTTVDLAHEEQIPVGLAQEMVAEVEAAGDICRDDGGGRVGLFGAMAESRWWVNTFVAFELQNFPEDLNRVDRTIQLNGRLGTQYQVPSPTHPSSYPALRAAPPFTPPAPRENHSTTIYDDIVKATTTILTGMRD
ncbi:hypothetical protein EIP86_000058 [Pleurotus ostreatoroseus]|nr:hypothetical protein EIP86_000058 [Pleurotus ostreatoroseus]